MRGAVGEQVETQAQLDRLQALQVDYAQGYVFQRPLPIADFFGLRYEVNPENKAIIDHSLRTAVISPDGKVTKIFAGNDWTPTQLVDALKAAEK